MLGHQAAVTHGLSKHQVRPPISQPYSVWRGGVGDCSDNEKCGHPACLWLLRSVRTTVSSCRGKGESSNTIGKIVLQLWVRGLV